MDLDIRASVKAEWEGLRLHDVGFLITLQPQYGQSEAALQDMSFVDKVGARLELVLSLPE